MVFSELKYLLLIVNIVPTGTLSTQ